MEFERLLEIVGDEPLFESALLLAGDVNPQNLQLQLSRWKKAGRIYQLRRGLYALAPPYQKTKPHPFVIANRLVRPSYVSGLSTLAFYGLIPENVPLTVSVTTGRPGRRETPLGAFHYHHIQSPLFRGYRLTDLSPGQRAFIAAPEKALLDLIYLQPGGAEPAYLQELRLQNLDRLDLDVLHAQADWFGSPKIRRAVSILASLMESEQSYETL